MIYYQDSTVTLHHGHVLDVLPTLEAGSVDCVVTSPPYYGLRDYGVDGQIGAEASPAEYVDTIRAVFAEVRRVLANDGVMFLNLGDSYAGGGGGAGGKAGAYIGGGTPRRNGSGHYELMGVGPKNLLGIPWRVAFALQDDDSADIYELTPDAPEEIVSAVYLETCRTKTPKSAAAITVNTPSDGELPIQSDSPSEWQGGTKPTGTRSDSTDASTTNSTAKRKSSETSPGTDSATDVSDLLHSNTTGASIPLAPAVGSGESPSFRLTTSTGEVTSIDGSSELQETASSNGSAERDTRKDSESSATTATHPVGTTVHARTKKNVRMQKAQIRPEWFPYFKLVKQERWILRNAIIWYKKNAMPESVTDRLSTRYEMLFMFSKSRRYWFDLDPIREPHSEKSLYQQEVARRRPHAVGKAGTAVVPGQSAQSGMAAGGRELNASGANPGDVWTIPTTPFPGSHFAVFPPELPRRCIVAGCKPRVCQECGHTPTQIVEKGGLVPSRPGATNTTTQAQSGHVGTAAGERDFSGGGHALPRRERTVTGWTDCGHNAYRAGVVLDPFHGSGTTGMVATRNGRKYVGIELNKDYLDLSLRTRLADGVLDFEEPA